MEKRKKQIIELTMLTWQFLEGMIRELDFRHKLAAKDAPDDRELGDLLCELSDKIKTLRDISMKLGMCFVELDKIDLSKF